jgi:SAM-dependent methyltransferase
MAESSFLELLADIGRFPGTGDPRHVAGRYQAWIRRHGGASPALFAAWFNLGAELNGAGDKAGAIDAYRNALALRPDFYQAALNLGMILEAEGQTDAALAIWQQALQPEEVRTSLLAHRDRLAKPRPGAQQDTATVLHVGCGAYGREKLPQVFRGAGWREIRLDIDPDVQPDLVASVTDMRVIGDGTMDAVYSSHNIEHLYPHEGTLALSEMRRVLKPDGFLLITLPDLQEVARHIADGRLNDPLYVSPMGPIAPLDILFGHRPSLARGNTFMAHRSGFTGGTLAAALIGAGFSAAMVQRDPSSYALTAVAFRSMPGDEERVTAQACLLPAGDLATVLYTAAG